MGSSYVRMHPRTIDIVVDEKMKVLTELCVVDKNNYKDVRALLFAEIRKYPNMDMDRVADRIGRMLFSKKFG